MATEIEQQGSDPLAGVQPADSIESLKERAARIRAERNGGKAPGHKAGADTVGGTDAPDVAPADAGVPDGQITQQASAELAKLAAKQEAASGSEEAGAGAGEGSSGVDLADALKAEGSTGESFYDRRKREIAEAKARPDGKGKKSSASASKGAGTPGAGSAASKPKGKGKAEETAKAREKAQAEKAKEKEAARKAKEKEQAEARKKAEAERKAKQAEASKAKAAERAARQTPDLIARENKATQAAFAEDYALAGPKSDRNPNGLGVRRAKSDRGDFAAGYLMALRRLRREAKKGGTQLGSEQA